MNEEQINLTISETESDTGHYDKRWYLECIKYLKADRDSWKDNCIKVAMAASRGVVE